METKKYYIRESAFGYNDEYMYFERGFGDIKSSFDNLEEAIAELKRLTFTSLRDIMPEQFETISFCHKANNEESKKLDAYMRENFDKRLLVPSDYSEGLMPDRNFTFPREMTMEQAWEIRELSGIRQFELIEVSGEKSSFWGIQYGKGTSKPGTWMERAAARFNNETHQHISMPIPMYYNSEEDAKKGVVGYYIMRAVEGGLKGTYEELSDTPQLLQSLVEGKGNLVYDEVMKEISGNFVNSEKLLMLNSLLKEKLFHIVPFPMDEIQALGTGWYAEV